MDDEVAGQASFLGDPTKVAIDSNEPAAHRDEDLGRVSRIVPPDSNQSRRGDRWQAHCLVVDATPLELHPFRTAQPDPTCSEIDIAPLECPGLVASQSGRRHEDNEGAPLRANEDETWRCREFRLEGAEG